MLTYLLRRALVSIPTLIIISIVLFTIVTLAPGDPLAEFALNPAVSAETREQLRVALGLDQPLPIRYVRWVTAFLRGQMGYSFTSQMPVRTLLAQRLGTTLWIVGAGYGVSLVLSLVLGVLSALKPGSLFDRAATTWALSWFSTPTFLTGILFILVFSVKLRWLPSIYTSTLEVADPAGLAALLRQSAMPVAVLALFQTATLMRFVRSAILDQAHQEYVRAARARGIREFFIVSRHILRNALVPVITLVALGIPTIFTGAIVTEQIFRVPGIGSLLVRAIETSDTPVVMAITFLYAILVVLCNLVADVLYGLLDPRVRLGEPVGTG
ncbi:MAG: ABC transporter permease [Chloroflexaceae bacterium]|nr:ABC transporter permease [Chloroflexaceae bacterium]